MIKVAYARAVANVLGRGLTHRAHIDCSSPGHVLTSCGETRNGYVWTKLPVREQEEGKGLGLPGTRYGFHVYLTNISIFSFAMAEACTLPKHFTLADDFSHVVSRHDDVVRCTRRNFARFSFPAITQRIEAKYSAIASSRVCTWGKRHQHLDVTGISTYPMVRIQGICTAEACSARA